MRAVADDGRTPEAGVQKTVEVNKPVVIARIHNGLGNQMFQYAYGMSVAKQFDLELKLDLSWFLRNGKRSFRLSQFENFRYAQATESELAFVNSFKGRALSRWNQFLTGKQRKPICDLRLGKNCQGERYFKGSSSSVRSCFKFPSLQSEAGRRTAGFIRGEAASVALHLRRGDYLRSRKHSVVTAAYYTKAMEFVETRALSPRYFVFSDDISFCKSFFQGKDVYFVEGCASEMEEMHLMSLCDHSIIANSTFSWWGAWLGVDKKLVVTPFKWDNRERRNERFRRDGLFPASWHVLEF